MSLPLVPAHDLSIILAPVSYTHLDVYKRQGKTREYTLHQLHFYTFTIRRTSSFHNNIHFNSGILFKFYLYITFSKVLFKMNAMNRLMNG